MSSFDDFAKKEEELATEVTKRFKKSNPNYKGSLRIAIRFGNPTEILKKFESEPQWVEEVLDLFVDWAELEKAQIFSLYKQDPERRPLLVLNEGSKAAWDKYYLEIIPDY